MSDDGDGGLDPSEVARAASGGESPAEAFDGGDGGHPGADGPGEAKALPDGDASPLGALLHTEPDIDPESYERLEAWQGELLVGGMKVVDHYGGPAPTDGGEPAAVNFARGIAGAVEGVDADAARSAVAPDEDDDGVREA